MNILYFILLLVGALCFLGAATGRAGLSGRDGRQALGLLPLGLFFWILVPLIHSARVAF